MSVSRRRRRTIRWARYANRYTHIPLVVLGGWPLIDATLAAPQTWKRVRRHQKHTYGEGYKS